MEVRSILCVILIPNINEINQAVLEYFNLFGNVNSLDPFTHLNIIL